MNSGWEKNVGLFQYLTTHPVLRQKNSCGLGTENPHKRQITMSEHIKGNIFLKIFDGNY